MNFTKSTYRLLGLASTGLAIALSVNLAANSVTTRDGTVAFESGISLVDVYSTFNSVRVRQSRYFFELELPESIGEPLQKLVIRQRTGGENIDFKPEKTEAFLGGESRKAEVEATAVFDEAESGITIEFAQPIAPGNRVTVSLKPRSNPDLGGVYLFGVTAFPEGEKSRGLYLGPGRIQIFDSFR
ncbi:MAG: DUF2808 domain-containing protein [Cyanobacteria bacterium J06607_15]